MSGASEAVAKYSTELSYQQDVVTDCGPQKVALQRGLRDVGQSFAQTK
jgi:hypothetical protein